MECKLGKESATGPTLLVLLFLRGGMQTEPPNRKVGGSESHEGSKAYPRAPGVVRSLDSPGDDTQRVATPYTPREKKWERCPCAGAFPCFR